MKRWSRKKIEKRNKLNGKERMEEKEHMDNKEDKMLDMRRIKQEMKQ